MEGAHVAAYAGAQRTKAERQPRLRQLPEGAGARHRARHPGHTVRNTWFRFRFCKSRSKAPCMSIEGERPQRCADAGSCPFRQSLSPVPRSPACRKRNRSAAIPHGPTSVAGWNFQLRHGKFLISQEKHPKTHTVACV